MYNAFSCPYDHGIINAPRSLTRFYMLCSFIRKVWKPNSSSYIWQEKQLLTVILVQNWSWKKLTLENAKMAISWKNNIIILWNILYISFGPRSFCSSTLMTTLNQVIPDQAEQSKMNRDLARLNACSLCEVEKLYHQNNTNTFCYSSNPLPPLFYQVNTEAWQISLCDKYLLTLKGSAYKNDVMMTDLPKKERVE